MQSIWDHFFILTEEVETDTETCSRKSTFDFFLSVTALEKVRKPQFAKMFILFDHFYLSWLSQFSEIICVNGILILYKLLFLMLLVFLMNFKSIWSTVQLP